LGRNIHAQKARREHTRAEGAEGTYTRRRRGARTKLFPLGGSLREESPGPVGNAGGVTPLEHELRESGPGPCKFRLAATRGTAGQTPRGRGRRSPGATPEECAPTPRRSFRGGTKPGLCACCSLGPSRCALEWAFALCARVGLRAAQGLLRTLGPATAHP